MPVSNVVVSAAVVSANGTSAAVGPITATRALNLVITTASVSGTSPTLAVEVQWSMDGTTFGSADGTADTFASITTAKTVAKSFTPKAPYYRLSYTVGGTTPSFTVTATEQQL